MGFYRGPNIVRNGLVLCLDAASRRSYPGTGTVWTDLSGNGLNATLTNGPTFNSANGGAIAFDGTNDFANTGNLGTITSFTVLIWFYPTNVVNYQNPIDCNYNYNATTGNIGPRLEMLTGGQLVWIYSNITNSNNSYYGQDVLTSGLAANTWHFAGITYNSSGNTSTTYYNGNATANARVLNGTPTGFVGTMNNINLGRGFFLDPTTRNYAGRVANVQIYNRPLSATEILQNYNAQKSRFGL